MGYIDGFVAAVPTDRKDEYFRHAAKAAEIFKEHGALRVVECWGDDVPEGEKTSFLKAVDCSSNETVVFSWVLWPSREARNAGMELIENDARMSEEPMPFDGSRLIYGGFHMVLNT